MRVFVSIVVIVALTGCEPMGRFPGGALAGEVNTPPDDWAMIEKIETVQLETNPDDPYSVNLWVVSLDNGLYIAAGGGETRWSKQISIDPEVRLRINHKIYELRASSVDDNEELEEVRRAYVDKYAMESDSAQFNDSRVFRLDQRY